MSIRSSLLFVLPSLVACASPRAELPTPKLPAVAAAVAAPVEATREEHDEVTAYDVEPPPAPLHVVKLAAGQNGTAALLSDGTIRAWGGVTYRGDWGMGDPDLSRAVVRTVKAYAPAKDISVENDRVCARFADRSMECGYDVIEQSKTRLQHPIAVPGDGAQAVAHGHEGGLLGTSYACGIRTNGTLGCWGMRIGREWEYWSGSDDTYIAGEETVPGLRDVTAVTISGTHACALANGGAMYCWGFGGRGQLGNGKYGSPYTELLPQPVKNIAGVEEIAVGSSFTCARTRDGAAYCWGKNDDGQLALGDTTQRNVPTEVGVLRDAKQIVAGERHACALLENGVVTCWGWNGFGQLGNGKVDAIHANAMPAPVPVL